MPQIDIMNDINKQYTIKCKNGHCISEKCLKSSQFCNSSRGYKQNLNVENN